jgi:hypothetical protein
VADTDWGSIIAELTARAAAAEAILAHLLANGAKRESDPKASLARIFDDISALLDEFDPRGADQARLAEMTRKRLSLVMAKASRLLGT